MPPINSTEMPAGIKATLYVELGPTPAREALQHTADGKSAAKSDIGVWIMEIADALKKTGMLPPITEAIERLGTARFGARPSPTGLRGRDSVDLTGQADQAETTLKQMQVEIEGLRADRDAWRQAALEPTPTPTLAPTPTPGAYVVDPAGNCAAPAPAAPEETISSLAASLGTDHLKTMRDSLVTRLAEGADRLQAMRAAIVDLEAMRADLALLEAQQAATATLRAQLDSLTEPTPAAEPEPEAPPPAGAGSAGGVDAFTENVSTLAEHLRDRGFKADDINRIHKRLIDDPSVLRMMLSLIGPPGPLK